MNELTQLKYLQITLQGVAMLAIPYAIYVGMWNWLGWMLLAYFIYGFFGVTVGYHRMEAHRSFNTYAPIRYILIGCGMASTIASPLMNILVHRSHHKYADTNHDSHSPINQGIKEAWFGEWMDRRVRLDHRLAKKEIRNPFYLKTHKYYVPILLTYALILLAFDWKAMVYLYCVPAALLFHVKGFFNTFGHTWGYRNFECNDQSRNSWLVNIVTMGDGWHNNHHANPGWWNTRVKWWELDFAAWIIFIIRKR